MHHTSFVILSIHSLCGRPLLPVPSNLLNTTDLIFLSFSSLHICPKSLSFLVIIFCIRFSVRSILLYNSSFVTFFIQLLLFLDGYTRPKTGLFHINSPVRGLTFYHLHVTIYALLFMLCYLRFTLQFTLYCLHFTIYTLLFTL